MFTTRFTCASAFLVSLLALSACTTAPVASSGSGVTPAGMQISTNATTTAPSSAPESPATVMISMVAPLSGKNQVPPNNSPATGNMDARLAMNSNVLDWNITFTGMSGPVTAAHFHGPASAGQNAGIALPLSGNMASPIKGSATLSAAQIADLRAGKWYINLHTAAFPDGEIRGQVSVKP